MAINMEYVLREKEDIRKALEQEIKAVNVQLKVMPIVAEALKMQDGKVYNKRVDEALRNCLGTYEEKEAREHEFHGICVYLGRGWVSEPGSLKINISTSFSRAAYYSEISPNGNGAMVTLAGKATRFNAAPLVQALEEEKVRMLDWREKCQNELGNLDAMIDLYVETYNKVLHFQNSTTSTFREHLKIKNVY